MTISREHDWLWDSWYCRDGNDFHAFHLTAPKALKNPDLRHHNARVGHSVSHDLITWETLPDALVPGKPGSFDDKAIWTGSVIRHDDVWHMFYTGIDNKSNGAIQRIGHATSTDLISWTRVSQEPIVTADSRWYGTADVDPRQEEPFRDPWVFFLEEDNLWHMLITAREGGGNLEAHGTIAHATSPDLNTWKLGEPLCTNSGFAQLEVLQVEKIENRWFVIFCSGAVDVWNDNVPAAYGTYAAPAEGPLGPFHLEQAVPLAGGGIYAARIVKDASGAPHLIGFLDDGAPGGFTGTICNPLPLRVGVKGTLEVLEN